MKRVLLLGWGAIGDTIHAIPAIKALRRGFAAGDEIWFESFLAQTQGVKHHDTVAPDLLVPLGLVDRVRHRVVPAGRLGIGVIEAAVLAAVVSRRFDLIFVMMPFAVQPALLALLGRVSSRLCVAIDPATGRAASAERPLAWHLLEVLRVRGDLDLGVENLDLPFVVPPAGAVAGAGAWLARHRRHPERRLVAIAPDTSYPANRWPTGRFVDFIRTLNAGGGFEVVLCGGSNSSALCAEIATASGGTLVCAGQLSILETAALFQRCALMVGLDTGTTHLAAACGAPYVALYGQRGSGRWYYPPRPNGVVLQREVPCRGCWLTECREPGHPCLTNISVEAVLGAVSVVLAGHRP